ncbi:uncharacterized protein TM35_000063190 [Trypanosoma theileri]|uniref:Trichohyalin-plectin-homology domain-containing protein n=1 Tax=Trypanosoma theileri TaxID=67003 RepID=A0A1X0P2Z9_9TRYP|nr:uncharacterized protein TM35_000063190 [Trypanosoma theileri]ORC91314.1 hypothetical protein TM35_000063190 [Trypanosoma theileri]
MPLPPLEEAPRSMTRRNHLVERNRLRVQAYAPTRKELEDEEIRIAQQRQEQRAKMLDSWKSQTNYDADQTRPLPGGGPRSKRMKEAAAIKNPNYYQIVKQEDAQLKSERLASYKADMLQQLKEREEFLRKCREEEKASNDALVKINKDHAREMEAQERADARAMKEYMDRVRESNLRELEQKREKEQQREAYELSALRTLQQRQKEQAEIEERRARDVKRYMQLENEENHRIFKGKQKENKAREEAELKAMVEYDAALAEQERREQLQKRQQFKAEFEESIAKQKEFQRTHNYDEPLESIRMRNEKAAADLALIKQEERLRASEQRREYRNELMQQIREKQEWQLSHLDGV